MTTNESLDCKHLKGDYCKIIKQRLENGYAIRWHCSNCKHYEAKK